ncbi:hypothetical protein BB560_006113 [Smittium megazygosporum]|uniref:OBG-type G domain-containing protein n=1 Tax=Smittium megazygosporum TaxID=133381 RepID=A0A2T9YGX1_9FUNG|nr:hypothetical protein BB560_006113 [Smittium megazygosporum]
MSDFVIACVGKPSAGKSSFLNAVTDATAKVGNYPFTTIEPNQGVAYYPTECPCAKYQKQEFYVAGLVPGASEGRGLGNKFLDDLRHADALIHVVDASGTTDENGKETKGYDPINDINWLRGEIHAWIYKNLMKRWDSIIRRHLATKSAPADTLQTQLSGYGSTKDIVLETLSQPGLKPSLQDWDADDVELFVFKFIDVRFPTIVALNKIDHPDSGKNINKIMTKYTKSSRKQNIVSEKTKAGSGTKEHQQLMDGIDENRIVLISALSEGVLKYMNQAHYIKYNPGDEDFVCLNDDPELLKDDLNPTTASMDKELERIRDLVLFRYFGTGTQEAIKKAVESLHMIPVYPVKNITNFTSDSGTVSGNQNKNSSSDKSNNKKPGSGSTSSNNNKTDNSSQQETGDQSTTDPHHANADQKVEPSKSVFRDCVLVKAGTTVRQLAARLHDEIDKNFSGAVAVGNVQLAENEVIVPGKNNIICIKTRIHS